VQAAADEYELHYQDETHLETNPYLTRVWHKIGIQPTVPAAGTNRRLTCFGSAEACARRRVEVLCASQDSAALLVHLAALDVRHAATGRKIFLVPRARQRPLPHQQSQPRCVARAGRAAARHLVGALLPEPEQEGTRVAHPQTRRAEPSRPLLAGLRR